MSDILDELIEIKEQMDAARTIWYQATDVVPDHIIDDDGNEEPGMYWIKDADSGTVLLHPKCLDAFLDAVRAQGMIARELDREESERRAKIRLDEMWQRPPRFDWEPDMNTKLEYAKRWGL